MLSNIRSPLTTSPLTPALPQKPSLNMEVIQGVQRQERTSLMVLSQGNEKDKLEACRGSVLSQECTNLHRTGYLDQGADPVPLCTHSSGGVCVAAPKGMQRDHHVHTALLGRCMPQLQAQLGHAGPVSGVGCEVSTKDTHFSACKPMESCIVLPTAPEGATALVIYKNILSCST